MFSLAPVLVFVYLAEVHPAEAAGLQEPEAEVEAAQLEVVEQADQLEVVETVVLVSGELKLEFVEPQWSQLEFGGWQN